MKLAGMMVVAGLLMVSTSAFAQSDDATETKDEEGWRYTFKDDLVGAAGVDAGGPVITVRPMKYRERLIRPRLSFVQEMFKSVEKL